MASRQSASPNDILPSDSAAAMANIQLTAANILAELDAHPYTQFTTPSASAANVQTTTKFTTEALPTGVPNSTTHHRDHPPPMTTATTNTTTPSHRPPSFPPSSSPTPPSLTIPHTLFFYGTLQCPTTLQSITRLPSPLPSLQDAHIHGGYDLGLWGGKYPALIPNPDSKTVIRGKLWRIGEEDGFGAEEWARLRRYEGGKYGVGGCVVGVGGGDGEVEEVKAAVFKWAGEAGSEELTEGFFDLDAWREKFMGPFFGWFDD